MKQPGTIAIRTDGARHLGMGHVMRTLCLARALARAHATEAAFVMRDFPEGVRTVREAGFEVEVLPRDERVADTRALLRAREPAAVVIDMLDVPDAYVRELRAEAPTVCLTSLGQTDVAADVVVNGDIRFGKSQIRSIARGGRAFLGTDFFILRETFSTARDAAAERGRDDLHVLVTFGGSDLLDMTPKVVAALDRVPGDLRCSMVLGPAFVETETYRAALRSSRREIRTLRTPPDMATVLAGADLVITAGGFTVYELAALGVPAVILCQVEHQLETSADFSAAGTALDLGMGDVASIDSISASVRALLEDPLRRRDMGSRGRELVDGEGAARVCELLMQHLGN